MANTYKVILLGDQKVGKTALLKAYVRGDDLKDGEPYNPTIGSDFLTKEIVSKGKKINLQVWDTSGQDRFAELAIPFYRGASCCVLCFDVNSIESFENLNKWREEFLAHAAPADPSNFPFIVMGLKTDKDSRSVAQKKAITFAELHNAKYFEVSSVGRYGLANAFEAVAAAVQA